jgi:hypothetical protein
LSVRFTIATRSTQLEELRAWLSATPGQHWFSRRVLDCGGGDTFRFVQVTLTFRRDADALEFLVVWRDRPQHIMVAIQKSSLGPVCFGAASCANDFFQIGRAGIYTVS